MGTCPACENTSRKNFGVKNGFDLFRCNSCSTLYAEVKPNNVYDYEDYYDNTNLDIPEFVKIRLGEIVATFDKFRQTNRLIDIGCGAGYLLEEAKKQNWNVIGTEISNPAVKDLRAREIEVFQGDLSQVDSEHNSFDVVISTEVIEHVDSPVELANAAFKLLRKGGLFWGTTPNGKGLSANLLKQDWSVITPPEHIQLFTKTGLRKTLERAGFGSIEIITEGVNPLEIYHHFRGRLQTSNDEKSHQMSSFDRVDASYQINGALSQGLAKNLIKKPANFILNTIGLGDSLKFWAIKK